ncbi:set1 complex component spp1 [Trichoderma cornu-damae]|uniref:Set1 complex component spp1 n=1 Tax=Trichoderma cornu-damae TaxID=654480 RepID=A0A9P8QHM4_9HYPO|nr:set1 complex component spp1 [Trichoderma cornu-damae]
MDPERIFTGPYIMETRFELIEDDIKSEGPVNSPTLPLSDAVPAFKSSTPLPSTETAEATDAAPAMAGPAPIARKKKGTATAVKKTPKRPKSVRGPKKPKSAKSSLAGEANGTAAEDASDEDDESDNGPYCICRGPDDHRWMICCERCEDWFHGECVHIGKDVGESLVEKFICPNCTTGDLVTIYKKTCTLDSCRKAARLTHSPPSVFCSEEHAQTWWERMLARLPKARTKAALSDELSQEEFMALLSSDLATIGGDGSWTLRAPFSGKPSEANVDETGKALHGLRVRLDLVPLWLTTLTVAEERLAQILTEEEKEYLDRKATARFKLAEETLLCQKMISLVEMVQERRRAAISAGLFAEDICGYDQRLDSIGARDAFAAFVKSPEGEAIFQASKVDDPLGEGDEVRGMCERKRCKIHSGWHKMLLLAVRHQIKELAGQAAEVGEEERILREAAEERWRRRQAEQNWVEALDG